MSKAAGKITHHAAACLTNPPHARFRPVRSGSDALGVRARCPIPLWKTNSGARRVPQLWVATTSLRS